MYLFFGIVTQSPSLNVDLVPELLLVDKDKDVLSSVKAPPLLFCPNLDDGLVSDALVVL